VVIANRSLQYKYKGLLAFWRLSQNTSRPAGGSSVGSVVGRVHVPVWMVPSLFTLKEAV
jgi:hypothetical protein